MRIARDLLRKHADRLTATRSVEATIYPAIEWEGIGRWSPPPE